MVKIIPVGGKFLVLKRAGDKDFAARCECALHPRGGEQVQRSAALSLCFEHRFELGESGRIPPSFLRSFRRSMPPIPSNWIYVQTHSGRGRRTDRQGATVAALPRKFAKWILSTPDLWTGGGETCQPYLGVFVVAVAGAAATGSRSSRRGVGALIHIQETSFIGFRNVLEKSYPMSNPTNLSTALKQHQ